MITARLEVYVKTTDEVTLCYAGGVKIPPCRIDLLKICDCCDGLRMDDAEIVWDAVSESLTIDIDKEWWSNVADAMNHFDKLNAVALEEAYYDCAVCSDWVSWKISNKVARLMAKLCAQCWDRNKAEEGKQ